MFNFETFPLLETPRLRLRQIIPSDAESVFAIRGDYEVTKYNSGAAYESIDQAQALIDSMTHYYEVELEIRWGITLKPHDTVIGMAGFNYWNQDNRRASIGFDLAQAYWRQGIMQEAIREILRFGFQAMELNRIEADASAENAASISLLKRLGFVQEGLQRDQYYEHGRYYDLVLFSLLRRDWSA